jgi:hypothetical protein
MTSKDKNMTGNEVDHCTTKIAHPKLASYNVYFSATT